MNESASRGFPDSFDPAVELHSKGASSPVEYSDDLRALDSYLCEKTAQDNRDGIVIQHRAWSKFDRVSSEDCCTIETPTKPRFGRPGQEVPVGRYRVETESAFPSSPPVDAMAVASSPIAYSMSPSPAPTDGSRKRRRLDSKRSPLKQLNPNARIAGFLIDSDEDEEPENDRKRKIPSQFVRHAAQAIIDVPLASIERTEEHQVLSDSNKRDGVDGAHATGFEATTRVTDSDEQLQSLGEQRPQYRLPTALDLPSTLPTITRDSTNTGILLVQTCKGRSVYVGERKQAATIPYERLIAARSSVGEGNARKSYYGVDIHRLMDEAVAHLASKSTPPPIQPTIEALLDGRSSKNQRSLMWTEKYRARKFTDLVGDERTHRSVLRWLKAWDPIVFPGSAKARPKASYTSGNGGDERVHRKILMLTGPPGLGKTTLAHVCARQAGYEVHEVNASDERSKDVVKGRIRDMVATENVRVRDSKSGGGRGSRNSGRPACVIIDEVDGVVGGSGQGGEGGFIKALIDLVMLDQKNSSQASADQEGNSKRKRKGDRFRLLRPLILICNDIYHPSLRPLRQSSISEIVYMRKPPFNMVVSRIHSIFEKEGIPSDVDAVRNICEATWGVSSRKDGASCAGTADGDIRSVMVFGEWIAAKLRAATASHSSSCQRLTRAWVEEHVLGDLAPDGGARRSLGRGGAREVVDRVFMEDAGFAKTIIPTEQNKPGDLPGAGVIGVAEAGKRRAIERLREMIDMSGESERIMTDCYTGYPNQPIQDDTLLSKPCAAYDWLHFHDQLHSQLTGSQEWELAPYLSSPVLAFHHLFASTSTARQAYASASTNALFNGKEETENPRDEAAPSPFSGPSAPFTAAEMLKANTSAIQALRSSLALPLARMYHSPSDVAVELLPYILRMLAPDVKPVVVTTGSAATGNKGATTASVRKASEKALVARAVECMAATGVRFERSRIEHDVPSAAGGRPASGGFVFRMEPPLDALAVFETAAAPGKDAAGVRYAVRQVLDAEWKKESVKRNEETRKRRMKGLKDDEGDVAEEATDRKEPSAPKDRGKALKRDFFGRIIAQAQQDGAEGECAAPKPEMAEQGEEARVWVSFHEGFSNAVRKPITLEELMRGF